MGLQMAARSVVVVGAATELGWAVMRQFQARGHQVQAVVRHARHAERVRDMGGTPIVADPADGAALVAALEGVNADVAINLIPQYPNSLLHDGHKWKGYATTLLATTTAFQQVVQARQIPYWIQGSYAFLYVGEENAQEDAPRAAPAGDPIFRAAIAAEDAILTTESAGCLLRLGYLYGPQSHDLRLYVRAFALHRPYFAGPASHRADWLHFEDAAHALALLAEEQPTQRVLNVVDNQPSSFTAFMDHFAHLLDHQHPGHIPMRAAPLVRIFIAKPHIELVQIAATASTTMLCHATGWQPKYPTYQEGLAQTLRAWDMPVR
jgi:nucleoside-diphosphate-sugar epimerase